MGFPGSGTRAMGGGNMMDTEGGDGGGEKSKGGDPRCFIEEMEEVGVDEPEIKCARRLSGMAKVLGSIFSVRSDSKSSKGSCSHGP
jgi:hypothetical protein